MMTRTTRSAQKRRIAILVASLSIAIVAAACAPPAPPAPPAAPPDATSVTILNLTNATRASVGLGALSWNGQLAGLAAEWSAHLVGVNALVHRDLNAVIRQPDYRTYRTLGENLLRGPQSMSPDAMHDAWVASPGHYANIVNPAFTSMGFAVAYGNGMVYATENFGG